MRASLSDACAVTCLHLSLPAWVYLSTLKEAIDDFPCKLICKQRLRKKLSSGGGSCSESFHMMPCSYGNRFCLACAGTDPFLSYEKVCACVFVFYFAFWTLDYNSKSWLNHVEMTVFYIFSPCLSFTWGEGLNLKWRNWRQPLIL